MIQIDREFQSLIPPLSAEEKQQLEFNLLADSCRDPLVLWGEILIDGHNRYEICTRLNIPYQTVSKQFANRDDAIEWIINNQFGRRNLSDYQRGVLALRMKPIIEARAKAQHAANGGDKSTASSPKSDAPIEKIRTDAAVAEIANLGKDTIRKIEHIEAEGAPEIRALAAADVVSVNLANKFTDLPVQAQQEAIAAMVVQPDTAKEVIREAVKKAHVAHNSGENEWYTPAKHIELARAVMGGIDCDPATSEIANRTVKAETIYTAEDDGRSQTWHGRVWMNPPYAQPLMGEFAEAVSAKYELGEIEQACILVNNATETQWFQRMLQVASAVCFPKSRIKFLDPQGNPGAPLQGQAIVYMGDSVDAFKVAFSTEGKVLCA